MLWLKSVTHILTDGQTADPRFYMFWFSMDDINDSKNVKRIFEIYFLPRIVGWNNFLNHALFLVAIDLFVLSEDMEMTKSEMAQLYMFS